MALPLAVETEIRPDATGDITVAAIEIIVAEVTASEVRLIFTLSFALLVSKFVPVIVSPLPGTPVVGVKLVIVGAPFPPLVTVKTLVLVAVPEGAITVMVPVVAPDGTVVMICVAVAEVTA